MFIFLRGTQVFVPTDYTDCTDYYFMIYVEIREIRGNHLEWAKLQLKFTLSVRTVVACLAILRPSDIHLLIVVLYEFSNLSYLPIVKYATIADDCIAIAFDEELSRASLSEFTITCMDVHTLHYAKGGKIEVITCYFEIKIFRHGSILHIFQVLL